MELEEAEDIGQNICSWTASRTRRIVRKSESVAELKVL